MLTHNLAAQGLTGTVKETNSPQYIPFAQISIVQEAVTITSFASDEFGNFRYESPMVGRIRITVSASGYKQFVSEEITLDGYSTFKVEALLESDPYNLKEVVLVESRQPMPSVYRITKSDLETVAGNYDDPVRVAISRPGIVQINDQANHISVRGQNPLLNTYYLEGLEIANPNHTNNAGTFSDRPTEFGGGINMFSAQILGSTDIYTGLNPLSIGRSAGAVIDMHVFETAKPEIRAKASLLGFELGGGKAVGENGFLDVNLRYSFTGLLAELGVDFGGERIGYYDGVIAYTHEGKASKTKLFAWGGNSLNEFDSIPELNERERFKDFFNIRYENDILGGGIKHQQVLSNRISLSSGAAYSLNRSSYMRTGIFNSLPRNIAEESSPNVLSSQVELTIEHSSKVRSVAGVNFVHRTSPTPLFKEASLRPFYTLMFSVNDRITMELGGEYNHEFISADGVAGYRGLFKWQLNQPSYLYAGIRHAGGQVFLSNLFPGRGRQIIVDKYEIGWSHTSKHFLNLKIYYQENDGLPVFPGQGGLFHIADFEEVPNFHGGQLTGTSRHYGIEGEWQYKHKNGWSASLNQSIYRSLKSIEDAEFFKGKFDGKYATHFTFAKEIIRQKKEKSRIWNFSVRGLFNGGLQEPAIDEEASALAVETVFYDPSAFKQQLSLFKRIDAGISRIIANQKIRMRYALDIQNLFGFVNEAYHYYDPFLQRIEIQNHLSFIPVLSIQASW
ncbi:MAG: carboxypeptidase-like regulatory domain-containing protein [Bacteroidota bacterium]|nr:carboxypeptidase-like regulatory domain-containing protein [Bacteroidota bacterium]